MSIPPWSGPGATATGHLLVEPQLIAKVNHGHDLEITGKNHRKTMGKCWVNDDLMGDWLEITGKMVYWLVVQEKTLWNIWVRQLGWWFYISVKIRNVPSHQPVFKCCFNGDLMRFDGTWLSDFMEYECDIPSGKRLHSYGTWPIYSELFDRKNHSFYGHFA